ncbi:hypothetical protein ETD86_32165 [Nonomuraea turkmeniaca]|uniref:Winged helix DNA-binding domain-containing protein n=1 Tax=Nonomuraea turkmeniaca TaxID=103838 RepID=A0A5S4F8D4_9ACTN|nr:hypothetical protein [Nonomuraea turkmeniaca]TMR12698.1 hypothetical protein ETD86_32165 [Nonomuraea turkmeniaca]
MLAILACAARPVSMDQMVSGIWGEAAPRNAEQSVYYVAGHLSTVELDYLFRNASHFRSAPSPSLMRHYRFSIAPKNVDGLLCATPPPRS